MWMEPTSEQLMVEMAWVRRLARALVRNDTEADDVAQETWLVASAEQPDEDRPLQPWLARVVRNRVRARRRGEARRDQRETAYEHARGEDVATPAELVERVELQRVVAGEVLALAEPYRSTVLLHFFEGMTSVEIARRLGRTPGSTKDYLSWLEDVDLVTMQRKRYVFDDPLLRLHLRLYGGPTPPTHGQIATEAASWAEQCLPKDVPEPEPVLAGAPSEQSGIIEID